MTKLTLTSDKAFEAAFGKYAKEALDSSVIVNPLGADDRDRHFYLRPSALPYCGLYKFLTLARDGIPKVSERRSSMLYYTEVGKTVHEVFQAIFGKHGRMLGDWTCSSCGAKYARTTYPKCTSKSCEGFEPAFNHSELSVKSISGWKGHCDNVFEWRVSKGVKQLWIIDYKTTNTRFIKDPDASPPSSYCYQQSAYVVLVEALLKQPVAGWCLVFLGRDNPMEQRRLFSHAMDSKAKKKTLAYMAKCLEQHRTVWTATKSSEVASLYANRLCHSIDQHDELHPYQSCEFRTQCQDRSKLVRLVKDTIATSEHLPLSKYMLKPVRREVLGDH